MGICLIILNIRCQKTTKPNYPTRYALAEKVRWNIFASLTNADSYTVEDVWSKDSICMIIDLL